MTALSFHISVSEKVIDGVVCQNTLVKIINYPLNRLLSAKFLE
jgi:hypothetical protein